MSNRLSYTQKRYRLKTYIYALKTKFWYKLFLKKCGKGNIIMSPLFLSLEEMVLNNHILIFDQARIEAVKKYQGDVFSPVIIFNDNVQIQQNLHLTCATRIEIGENTSIGAQVTITDINHPYENIHLPIERQPITTAKVLIGKDCKLYNNVVILPGTILGDHCTVGANSVVSGTYPDNSVIVGAPARIVKRYSETEKKWIKTDKIGNFLIL